MDSLEKCIKDKQKLSNKLEVTQYKLETSERNNKESIEKVNKLELDLKDIRVAKLNSRTQIIIAVINVVGIIGSALFVYLATFNKTDVKQNESKIGVLEKTKSNLENDNNQIKIFIINNYSPSKIDSISK